MADRKLKENDDKMDDSPTSSESSENIAEEQIEQPIENPTRSENQNLRSSGESAPDNQSLPSRIPVLKISSPAASRKDDLLLLRDLSTRMSPDLKHSNDNIDRSDRKDQSLMTDIESSPDCGSVRITRSLSRFRKSNSPLLDKRNAEADVVSTPTKKRKSSQSRLGESTAENKSSKPKARSSAVAENLQSPNYTKTQSELKAAVHPTKTSEVEKTPRSKLPVFSKEKQTASCASGPETETRISKTSQTSPAILNPHVPASCHLPIQSDCSTNVSRQVPKLSTSVNKPKINRNLFDSATQTELKSPNKESDRDIRTSRLSSEKPNTDLMSRATRSSSRTRHRHSSISETGNMPTPQSGNDNLSRNEPPRQDSSSVPVQNTSSNVQENRHISFEDPDLSVSRNAYAWLSAFIQFLISQPGADLDFLTNVDRSSRMLLWMTGIRDSHDVPRYRREVRTHPVHSVLEKRHRRPASGTTAGSRNRSDQDPPDLSQSMQGRPQSEERSASRRPPEIRTEPDPNHPLLREMLVTTFSTEAPISRILPAPQIQRNQDGPLLMPTTPNVPPESVLFNYENIPYDPSSLQMTVRKSDGSSIQQDRSAVLMQLDDNFVRQDSDAAPPNQTPAPVASNQNNPPYIDVVAGEASTSRHLPSAEELPSSTNLQSGELRERRSGKIVRCTPPATDRFPAYASEAQMLLQSVLKEILQYNEEIDRWKRLASQFLSDSNQSREKDRKNLKNDLLKYLSERKVDMPWQQGPNMPREMTAEVYALGAYEMLTSIVVTVLALTLTIRESQDFDVLIFFYKSFRFLYDTFPLHWQNNSVDDIENEDTRNHLRKLKKRTERLLLTTLIAFRLFLMYVGENAAESKIKMYEETLAEDDKHYLERRNR